MAVSIVMKNATIVFDLDGTLVDTAPDLMTALNHVMTETGLEPAPDAVIRPHIALGARHMIAVALEHRQKPTDDAELDALFERFTIHYSENIAVGSKPFPGLVGALDTFKSEGARLAVCTNKRESMTLKLLEELDLRHYFDAIVGRDTLDVYKPHPRHLTTAIEWAGGSVDRAVMIGDAKPDIGVARAANVPVVGATFGYTDIPIEDLEPDALFSDYAELVDIVRSLLAGSSASTRTA